MREQFCGFIFFCTCILGVLTGCSSSNVNQNSNIVSNTGANSNVPKNDSTKVEGALFPFTIDNQTGYMDAKGNVIIESRFVGDAEDFSDGLALVDLTGKGQYGYIDSTGNPVITLPPGKTGSDFDNGFACQYDKKSQPIGRKYDLINKRGDIVVKEIVGWDKLIPYVTKDKLLLIKKGGKFGYIDPDGNTKIDFQYSLAKDFHDGLAVVGVNGKFRYINTSGEFAFTQEFSKAEGFNEGVAVVSFPGDKGFSVIDKNGNTVLKDRPYKDRQNAFFDGLLGFTYQTGKWGFINRSGEITIAPTYKDIKPLNEGLIAYDTGEASVGLFEPEGNKWNLIDVSGKEVKLNDPNSSVTIADITFITMFDNGLARVLLSSGSRTTLNAGGPIPDQIYIDKTGKFVFPILNKKNPK